MAERKLKDWVKAYAEFTSKSDSPQIFHMWCCLATIAGAAQRKIFMQTLYYPVHSNMYIALVSPPGRGKKTAALRASKNILKEVQPEVNFATESGSFEGLVELFMGISNPAHQSLNLYSMELGTLMATNPAGMTDWLTDIYDGNPDWARGTVKHKRQTIKRPWLNMIVGTTPKWLGEHVGLIALEGGLVARMNIAYSDEQLLDNSWPSITPAMLKLKGELVHDLSIIANLEGEFIFEGGVNDDETGYPGGEAFQWYDTWYRDRSRFPAIADPRTASYYDRKHIHLLKVAMALSLSYKNELILTLEDLLRALKFLNSTEPGIRLALNAVGKSDTSNELYLILSQLKARGSMSYADLLLENYHNLRYGKKSLDQILEELRFMGRAKNEGGQYGKYIYVDVA